MPALELHADEGGHQPGERAAAARELGKRLGVPRQPKRPCRSQGAVVGEWKQLGPGELRLAEENIRPDLADVLELLQEPAFGSRVGAGGVAELCCSWI